MKRAERLAEFWTGYEYARQDRRSDPAENAREMRALLEFVGGQGIAQPWVSDPGPYIAFCLGAAVCRFLALPESPTT